MKVQCVKDLLIEAVSKTEKITSKNPTLPVLKCILLQAKENTLLLRATNLELGIEIKIPAKIEHEGIIAVPATIFNSFLSQIQSDTQITLEVVDMKLHVTSGSGKTVINGYSHDDFPTLPALESEKTFTIQAQDFVAGSKAVVYCASISSIKPELTSVLITQDEDSLVFAATDSFRLAEKRIRIKKSLDIGQILIPHKSVIELLRSIGDSREELTIVFNKNQISFAFGTTYITARIIEGVFPDYKQIIPKSFTTEVVLLKQDMMQALKLATVFSDSFNQVTFIVSTTKKSFEIKTKNTEVGENNNNLGATVSGEDVTSSFNAKYIMDCFQSISVDSITLQFNGTARPLIIRGISDASFTYLVMSMNK